MTAVLCCAGMDAAELLLMRLCGDGRSLQQEPMDGWMNGGPAERDVLILQTHAPHGRQPNYVTHTHSSHPTLYAAASPRARAAVWLNLPPSSRSLV
mmetsp:Transcript_35606/g.102310  ORF Transcript_35606/g.102310 Transcript_35606/m.102310 type:complete len:96 (+) Transcript_35606:1712-1999(+)